MQQILRPSRGASGENKSPYCYVPYALADHWWFFQTAAKERLDALAADGRKPRRNGLPWFAADATTPREEIGSYKLCTEWHRSVNRLAGTVPPSLRPTVGQLAKFGDSLQVELPRGRAIVDLDRVTRLQRDCLRRINREPINQLERDAEGHRIKNAWAIIDVKQPPLIWITSREEFRPLPVDAYVTTNATQAAAGIVRSVPSQPGYPVIGTVASQTPGGYVVIAEPPPDLPRRSTPRVDVVLLSGDSLFQFRESLDGDD